MPSETARIFISYSREDGSIVRNLTRLVAATGAHVFLDETSIEPGDDWQKMINAAIQKTTCLLVFWSRNAQRSASVKAEWTLASRHQKKVVPVILDNTPLPPRLSRLQAIDLRVTSQTRGLSNRGVLDTLLDVVDPQERTRLTKLAAKALSQYLDEILETLK